MKHFAVALFALLVTGCASTRTTMTQPKPTSLVFIGNSITLHPPEADVEWPYNWGMAVLSPEKDFVHLTAAQLNAPQFAQNAAIVENVPTQGSVSAVLAIVTPHITSATGIVIELGDNSIAVPLPDFTSAYTELLDELPPHQSLVCVSTFWEKPDIDRMIEQQCTAHAGRYLYIGDIQSDPNNPDWSPGAVTFENPAVEGHPHDWSMQQIANRVASEF